MNTLYRKGTTLHGGIGYFVTPDPTSKYVSSTYFIMESVPQQGLCGLCGRIGRRGKRGAKIVLINRSIPLVNYSFLCMLEFWQRLLSMIDKVSKSLQSKDIFSIAQLQDAWMLKSDHYTEQAMQNAGIDEITARATINAEEMDIPDQLPQKRRKSASRQKMRELILHPSNSLAMNAQKCMTSFSAWFSGDSKTESRQR